MATFSLGVLEPSTGARVADASFGFVTFAADCSGGAGKEGCDQHRQAYG
jgi:hypothetical protein